MAEIKTQRLVGYRHLIDIARDLASTLDQDILMKRIVHAAVEITAAEAASILLYDSTARQLHFQTATNLDQPSMRGLVVPLEDSIAGWIVLNRRPMLIYDVRKDPRHFNIIEQSTHFTTLSLLGVPLIAKDKVVGVLEVLNKKHGVFTKADENFLLVLGAQAAVAIENSRLFQQSDLISEFVHELRTEIASINTATYLLTRPEIPQQKREQIIKNLHSETMDLNAMVTAFLNLSRLESGRVQFHLKNIDVGELFHECRDVMQTKADHDHIKIKIDVPDDLPTLEADKDMIKQVIVNLLSNAIKYNRPDGSVILKAEANKKEIILSVQDTGVGIPEDELHHIFEKFYRVRETESKASGTGLGLSICKQIVQGHSGTIEVCSKLGQGTVFTVHLPYKTKIG